MMEYYQLSLKNTEMPSKMVKRIYDTYINEIK